MDYQVKYVSPSQMWMYASCGLRWWLNYPLRLKMPGNLNFAIGGTTHEIASDVVRMPRSNIDREQLQATFNRAWSKGTEGIYLREKDNPEKSKGICVAITDKFVKGFEDGDFDFEYVDYLPIGSDTLEPAVEIGAQCPSLNVLTGDVIDPNVSLTGALDFVGIDKKERLVIIDHKTAARAYGPSKIYKEPQLPFYHVLLMIMISMGMFPGIRKKKADAIMYGVMLKTKKAISSDKWDDFYQIQERTITDEELSFFYDNLEGVIGGMQNGPYIACPGMQCDTMCSHKPVCDAMMRGENPITAYTKFMQEMEANSG